MRWVIRAVACGMVCVVGASGQEAGLAGRIVQASGFTGGVIVHVGFAISKLDEEEAQRTFELLREIGEQGDESWLKDIADRSIDAHKQDLA